MLSDNLADKLETIKTRAASSWFDATEKVTALDDRLIDNMGSSISHRFSAWLFQHPLIMWSVNHPIISLVGGSIAIILILRLLATIYRAIANTIDRMWLALLRSPYLLLKLIFGGKVKPDTVDSNTTITNYEVTNNPEQLQEIMTRLDQIQQQQQQIVRDLAQLKQQMALEPQQLQLVEKNQ